MKNTKKSAINDLHPDIKMYKEHFKLNKNMNDLGEVLIDIRLSDYRSGFSEYSPRQDLRIDPGLYDYIISEHTNNKHPVRFNVYCDGMKNNTMAQELFTSVLKNALTAGRLQVYRQWWNTLMFGLFFLIFGISMIVCSQLVPEISFFTSVSISFLDIVAWVFGWGATEKILIEAPKLRREYLHLARLSHAKYVFFPYPQYNWFEKKINPSYDAVAGKNNIEIKKVTIENLDDAIYVQKNVFPDDNGSADLQASVGQMYPWIEKLEYYLAYIDGKAIGITGIYSYKDYPDDAWLAWFGVLPQFKLPVLELLLFDMIREKAKGMGFSHLRAYTDVISCVAESKFYESQGMMRENYDNNTDVFCRVGQTCIFTLSLKEEKPKKWDSKYLYLKEGQAANNQSDNAS